MELPIAPSPMNPVRITAWLRLRRGQCNRLAARGASAGNRGWSVGPWGDSGRGVAAAALHLEAGIEAGLGWFPPGGGFAVPPWGYSGGGGRLPGPPRIFLCQLGPAGGGR